MILAPLSAELERNERKLELPPVRCPRNRGHSKPASASVWPPELPASPSSVSVAIEVNSATDAFTSLVARQRYQYGDARSRGSRDASCCDVYSTRLAPRRANVRGH